MTAPANQADLETQKLTVVNLPTGEVEAAKKSKVVLLNLIDDQSARALPGVTSFVIHDAEEDGIEDTKTDGNEQSSNLGGGFLPTTMVINKDRTIPKYFYYSLGEASRLSFVSTFVESAPATAIIDVEKAAIAALRAIGATNYRQMTGTDMDGSANSVPSKADYKYALGILCNDKNLDLDNLRSIGSVTDKVELPAIFGLYDAAASSELGDLAKSKGFVREIMGVPHFASSNMANKEHIIFEKKAVSYAIRNAANLRFEGQASKSRDYYGVQISYGVVARQDNRAVVMQSGLTYTP